MRTWDGFGNVDNYASVDAGARDDEEFMQHYLSFLQDEMPMQEV